MIRRHFRHFTEDFYQHILLNNTKFDMGSINNCNMWHYLRMIMMFLCKETISYLAARSSSIVSFPLLLSLFSLFPLSGFHLFFLRFSLRLLFLQEVFIVPCAYSFILLMIPCFIFCPPASQLLPPVYALLGQNYVICHLQHLAQSLTHKSCPI